MSTCVDQESSYLCVDYSCHPEPLGWSRHRQHGPKENQDGQKERNHRGGDHVVEHDDEIAGDF